VYVSHVVNRVDFFSVPTLGPDAVVDFLEAHIPAGLSLGDFGTLPLGTDFVTLDPVAFGGAFDQPQLDIAIRAAGTGSELRVSAKVPWLPPRPANSDTPPSDGVLEITGYGVSSAAFGSTYPTTVEVAGNRAANILAALAALAPYTYVGLGCMENEQVFTVDFLPEKGAAPAFSLVDWLCPTPGEVSVTSNGHKLLPLVPDCALLQAVVAWLPRGKAGFTRSEAAYCR
jgi:hypothetical protein